MAQQEGKEVEIGDALEALRFAREQYQKVANEVFTKPIDGRQGKDSKQRLASERLAKEIQRMKSQLEEGGKIAGENSAKVTKQVQDLKGGVFVLQEEVDRLHKAIASVEESCHVSRREVYGLQERLIRSKDERDQLVRGLGNFMDHAKRDVEQIRVALMKQDTDIERLREQNDFMRLQQLQRASQI